jgi:hypothetical protein
LTALELTDWLRHLGSLERGEVTELRIEQEIETWVSKLAFVTATYSADAPPNLPRNLVVKTGGGSGAFPDNNSEIEFYRRVAPSLPTPPVVRCIAAIPKSEDFPEVLVLEDLRATHDHPPWPLPPSWNHCERAFDALAQVHARWWEAASLGHAPGRPHTRESLTAMVQNVAAQLPAFLSAVGSSLGSEGCRLLERVFSSSLQPWLRLTDSRALTIAHGDAHTWNFLFPRTDHGPAYLIDWQLWHIDVGARDLAFLMALHWFPNRRRAYEEPLLRYYFQALQTHGVHGYAFDELWLDYRRCVVRNLTIPILFWSRGMKPEGWWHRLECAMAAYADLRCEELL